MEFIADIFTDAAIDTIKLVPFLFVTYLAMEAIEHFAGDKAEATVRRAGVFGPVVGALVGAFPQCGFSAAAATLYAGRVVTLGTLFAVFLATSDEMLPIFIAEQADPALLFSVLGCKVAIGMVMGFLVDAVQRVRHRGSHHLHIHDLCEQEDCEEDEHVVLNALKHTVQVTIFIFLVCLGLGAVIELVGEETFAFLLSSNPELSVLACATVGLIPNCAASVVVCELFLQGAISTGAMMAGLLVGAGVGLLVLCRANRRPRSNAYIILVLWCIGVFWGFGFDLVGVTF